MSALQQRRGAFRRADRGVALLKVASGFWHGPERTGRFEVAEPTGGKVWNFNRRSFLKSGGGAMLAAALDRREAIAQAMARENTPRTDAKSQTKVIIDTDPGVDDALALLLAMSSPELKIEAITPVAGNRPLPITLSNALRMVEVTGQTEIPVAPGASSPLLRRLTGAIEAHGENGLAGAQFPTPRIKPVDETAAGIMRKIIRANPGEITVIGIGPLTNVATAMREDPDLPKLIKRIVLMGGSTTRGNMNPSAEFNFWTDPEAASIVFDAGAPITMVGLEVTMHVEMTPAHIHQLEQAPGKVAAAAANIAQHTLAMYRRERSKAAGFHLHDPLAVASVIWPDLVELEDFHVEIETEGVLTAGESVAWKKGSLRDSAPLWATTVNADPPLKPFSVNAQIATGVHPEEFLQRLIGRLTRS